MKQELRRCVLRARAGEEAHGGSGWGSRRRWSSDGGGCLRLTRRSRGSACRGLSACLCTPRTRRLVLCVRAGRAGRSRRRTGGEHRRWECGSRRLGRCSWREMSDRTGWEHRMRRGWSGCGERVQQRPWQTSVREKKADGQVGVINGGCERSAVVESVGIDSITISNGTCRSLRVGR